MLIYAHRGASKEEPENTLAAFRRAMEVGADGIEFDVHASADGVPVVIHDRDLSRTTNGTGNVDEKTLAELEKLDAGNGQHIPTLKEVLDLTAGKIRLYIELKQPGIERQVLDVLGNYAEAIWLIGSFDLDILRAVRKLAREIELWVITVEASDAAFHAAGEVAATALSIRADMVSPEVMRRITDASLGIAVWTVNDVEQARLLRDFGVDALCTDVPADIIAGLAKGSPR